MRPTDPLLGDSGAAFRHALGQAKVRELLADRCEQRDHAWDVASQDGISTFVCLRCGEEKMIPAERPECLSCGELDPGGCLESKKDCGHHCNHSWTHDECCWCGKKWGEAEC